MQPLSNLSTYSLQWVKPSWRKYHFELADGANMVATLDINGWMNRATGTTSAGTFIFKRAGFWKQDIIIHDAAGTPLATYTTHWTGTKGTLTFVDGAVFHRRQQGFWKHETIWTDAAGRPMFQYATNWKNQTHVTFAPDMLHRPEMSVIVLLSQYLAAAAATETASVAATTVVP